jgi:hypothetical protein
MEMCLKEFPSRRRVVALLSVLVFGLARQGSAQSNAITDYYDLVSALNAGVTNVTNFQTPLTIYLTTTLAPTIQITNNVTINAGTNSVIFQGNGTNGGTRFFYVHSNASLTLNNLLLTNGGSTNGGAIYNDGMLILSNCLLTGNYATNTNGAVGGSGPILLNSDGTNGGDGGLAAGGAIYSTGPVIISYSILNNNFVEAGNGGNGGSGGGAAGNGGNAGSGGNAYGGALYTSGSNNVIYMTEFAGNECFAGSGGAGGSYATNSDEGPSGAGGAPGLGGLCAGGAAFAAGPLHMTNCLFVANYAVGGGTGPAEVDSGGVGADGSPGGSVLGGGLFIANGVANACIENTIFFTNFCYGGAGGSNTLGAYAGGDGGQVQGGAVWSGATLTQMGFCTLATNLLYGGPGGANGAGGTPGATGAASGYLICGSAGVFDLSASILSYVNGGTNYPNAVGVTDAGYNISSDATPARSATLATTQLDTNPELNSGLTAVGGATIGGTLGSQPMLTLQIAGSSPAAGFVPGVPGSTFPATDEVLRDRGTPTSAGAFEYNAITILSNAVLPAITSIGPGTNLTGAGDTTNFTVVATSAAPFGYQWRLDGTNISDNANYSGTTGNILTIRKVSPADEGQYTVIISPTLLEGAVTSAPPMLLVLTNAPSIQKQPASQLNRPVGSIVTFTVNVGVYPQGYFYQWLLDGTNLPGRSEYSGTNGNVLTINPATDVDAGSYSVIVSNGFNSVDYGAVTSKVARLTIVPDTKRPTITMTSPLANSRTNTPNTLAIGGTATDNAQVTNVMYWFTNFNAGLNPATNVQFGYATLTTNGSTNLNAPSITKLWSITNPPWPGTNILAVQSVDFSSNVSAVLSRRFFYQVPTNLSLTILSNGGGGALSGRAFIKSDTAPSNGASLNIGEGYSIVAAPDPDSLLGRWTITNISGTNVAVTVTNGNTLKFIMESNTAIQALFVSNIFLGPGLHGAFNGLFYVLPEFVTNELVTNPVVGTNGSTNEVVTTNSIYTNEVAFESAGMLDNLVVGKQGAFSGKLLLAGGSYSLSGSFDAFGHVTNHSVARSAALGGPLIIDMDLDTNGAGIITGTVSNAAWPTNAYLWAGLAAVTLGTTNYTLLMAPPASAPTNMAIPTGYGYASLVDHGGTVTLGGGLADGTTFSQSVPASPSNNVPVYVSLYSKTGFLFGWLNLTNLDNTNAPYDLMWIKGTPAHPTLLFPDGFTNLLATTGSTWTNPGVITLSSNNTLAISNANLDLDYTVAIDEPDNLVNATDTPTNSLTGTINLKTGLLQVTFGNGDGRATTKGYGAMLQDTTNAGGYFVTKTNAGSIILNGSGQPFSFAQPFSFPQTPEGQASASELLIPNPLDSGAGPPLPPALQSLLDDSTNSPPPPR